MKLFFSGILILSISFSLLGQDIVLSKSYSDLSLSELIIQLEKDTELHFFYQTDWIENIGVKEVIKGSRVDHTLESILKETGLSTYSEGSNIYIFPGDPIRIDLTKLEEKIIHKAVPISDTLMEKGSNNKYILTNSISEESTITIGTNKGISNGNRSVVRGRITNKLNGEAMIGASVIIEELQTGTITDYNGNFILRLLPGKYLIAVNHMAMKEMKYGLNVLSDGEFNIELENELIELEEITVIDKRNSNVASMHMGFNRISTKSIKEIPAVMGEKDILKVAQMLPGVQNVGEGASGFNVRGGGADQNMFYINKISIYNTSHLFGFFTAFSPDIISDFSLYKNNVPSKYGGRIASVFEINTRQGNKDKFFAQGGISPITGHVMVEGPVIKEKVSFVASFRSTYSDWILKRINDHDLRQSNASFNDGTIALHANLNSNNQLEAFYYQSSDKFALSNRNDYSYANRGGSFSWKHKFSESLSADLSFSTSNYRFSTIDKNNISEAYSHDYVVLHSEARADFLSVKYDNHRIEYGVSSILYDLNRGDIIPFGSESKRVPVSLGREQGTESAIYISDEFGILPRLTLLAGMRYSIYGQLGPAAINEYETGAAKNKYSFIESINYGTGDLVKSYSGFEPRAALNYSIGPANSIKASYNRLRQYIFLLSNTIAIAPNDQWKLTDYHIKPPVSDQLSVGYYHDFAEPGINISVELYKKWVNNVVEYKDGADFISPEPIETQVLQGFQDSRGVEFMLKKNNDKLTGWITYTYSRSTILIDDLNPDLTVNGGKPFPSNFDRPHSFNLVSNYRISKRLSFSSTVVYTTGRPVTLPVASYYAEGRPFLLYSERNAYRIPDYFRVDLSVNLEGNLRYRKAAHSYWMLNVYNLTGRHNTYSVFYEVEDAKINGYKLSIFARPIITLSWNFKFGNYNSDK